MSREKLLVLGGSSFVGRHLLDRIGSDRVLATYRSRPLPGGVRFDALRHTLDEVVVEPGAYSHAFVLFAEARPDDCARDPEGSRRLNVERTLTHLDWLMTHDICPVFASTEAVFDGRRGRYREDDPPAPLMLYGAQKVEVERHLSASGRPHLIVRLGRVYGETPGDGTLFTDWKERLDAGQAVRCARDHVFTPIHAGDAAAGLLALAEIGATGLFHLSSQEPLSRLQMLHALLEAAGPAAGWNSPVEECSMADFPTLEPRPRDVSLDPSRFLAATGLHVRSVEEFCRQLARGRAGAPSPHEKEPSR